MPKWAKLLLAVLLLPACMASASALARCFRVAAGGATDPVWVPLLAGAASWLVIYAMLPRPMWLYVLGHELTHAVWTWLFLGSVKSMKVSSRGGHVKVSKENFLTTLAPYFFPLYAVLVAVVYHSGAALDAWEGPMALGAYHLALGAAYAFHVTLTACVLQVRQPDLDSQGILFSVVVIFLGNALVLMVALPLLTQSMTLGQVAGWWWESLVVLAGAAGRMWHRIES